MTKRLLAILVGLCFVVVTPLWAQTVNMNPIQVHAWWLPSYFFYSDGLPVGESGWFNFREGSSGGIFYTNVVNLPSRDIRWGDTIRLRTVGTARRDRLNPDGTTTIMPEVPQPFLGLFCGAVGSMGGGGLGPYKPLSPVATGLPEYVTPLWTNYLSEIFPSDIPEDFLIPPDDGVTLCVPAYGNVLVLLNPDFNNLYGGDPDHDFGVVIEPLEKARLAVTRTLSSSNVMVGDTFTLTLGFTNYGNAPVEGVHMYIDDQLAAGGLVDFHYYSNLLERISGPVPDPIASIPPGGSAQITYTFKAIDGGTNWFYARIGRTICGGSRFQQVSYGIGPQVIAPVTPITMRQPTPLSFLTESVNAGKTDGDAPLVFSTDEGVLAPTAEFKGRGLVADGVTPLLLRIGVAAGTLDSFPAGMNMHLEAQLTAGSFTGVPANARLRILKNGLWVDNAPFTLTKDKPQVYATLAPILSDEVKPTGTQAELTLQIEALDDSGLRKGKIDIAIRRPPIVLIHGYYSSGDWGDDFTRILGLSRGTDFVRVAKYGQSYGPGKNAYVKEYLNTLLTLDELVPMAGQAFEDAVAPLRDTWAFTRYDAVCHSQGGLLTRMLCSQKASLNLHQPFRNESNQYRGRFHRVVTIGSPHNGTRLLRYLLAMNASPLSLLRSYIPQLIGKAGVFIEAAQEKFDPFGVQIRDLNNPSPLSRWTPDPAAKFHLVRATVNLGHAPYAEDMLLTPSYTILGLFHPVAGPAVLPRGSDGIVDFDSMGAQGPGQPAGANVFTLNRNLRVSHAPPLAVFGAGSSETASTDVAAHVIAALDHDSTLPASDLVFASFVPPPLLDDSIRQQIDHWAGVATIDYIDLAITALHSAGQVRTASSATNSLRFVLSPPAELAVTNRVMWFAEAFTTNGIDPLAVTLDVDPADSRNVTARFPSDLVGDVVLYASYVATNGAVVLAKPLKIFSSEPPGTTLLAIEVAPDEMRLPVGSDLPIEFWTLYSNGLVIQRHVEAAEVTAQSSDTNVVSVVDPLAWRLVGAGEATITVGYRGLSATNSLTAYTPIPPDVPSLTVEQQADQVLLRWPVTSGSYLLESAASLSPGSSWEEVSTPPDVGESEIVVTAPITDSQRYYRLRHR